jgi:HTH-type transcriptional regulator/antitoxin HigA
MITNDWQLRVTSARVRDFEDALFELGQLSESKEQPWLRRAQRESLESELKKLKQQIAQYEDLKISKEKIPAAETVAQIPTMLIQARVSKGLTQEQLAKKLSVSKQRIQHYEKTFYANVRLSTIQQVADVLAQTGRALVRHKRATRK